MSLLIRGAEIYDGGGGDPFFGDIFVSGERISAIGQIPARHAKTIIDANGCKVCPGFIDAFSKTDHYCGILDEPEQAELLKNGITTAAGGQEGVSLAPLSRDNLELIEEWAGRHRNLDWHSLAEFLAHLRKRRLGVNFGTLIGAETARRMLPAKKRLTGAEKALIQRILKTALAEGGLGTSRGQTINDKWRVATPFLTRIAPARIFLPEWVSGDSQSLSDQWLRSKIIPEIKEADPKRMVIAQAPGHDSFVGNTLWELAQIFRFKDWREALLRLLLLTRSRALLNFPAKSPEELRRELLSADVLLGTAGASFGYGRKPKIAFADENVSALAHFLTLAFLEGLMPLAAAVRKITAIPARALGIKDRGELQEGKFADITGFTLDPRSGEISVRFVVVNGKLAMRDGEFLFAAGKVITGK
jgi:N-acyl-D-aspartate/D-glutamate deacylase